VKVLKAARRLLAKRAIELAEAISAELARSRADTLTAEVLPLLDACKFLERNAARILRPRKLGMAGRPFWLSGVVAEVQRVPLGRVLVIGPANFPLFLPGVQVLQALAAGNRVTWKPGRGGEGVARIVAQSLYEAGLPRELLTLTDESVAAGEDALRRGADKVFVTGSAATGRAVLGKLAETATPAVVELSGADAVMVMPSADLPTVAKAVAFGLRLNGGAVCMSPRRLFASRAAMAALLPLLERELASVPAVTLPGPVAEKLGALVNEAVAHGATLVGELKPERQKPLVVTNADVSMALTQSDVFAPVISLMEATSMLEAMHLYARCPYALTVSIFCGTKDEGNAREMAAMLKAGVVLINDILAPTADPRLPFGGRGASGYGVTRGAEGLLEMTAVKTVIVRRGGRMRHLEATSDADVPLLDALIRSAHSGGWSERFQAMRDVVTFSRRRQ